MIILFWINAAIWVVNAVLKFSHGEFMWGAELMVLAASFALNAVLKERLDKAKEMNHNTHIILS